jgi:hypothetical protein
MHEWWTEKDMEVIMTQFKVLSQHLPGWTEENHEKPVRTAAFRYEIWTRDLQNMKEC